MKITFLNPPQTNSKYKFLGVVAPSLGIGYMAAVLEKNGYDVDVLDASALELSYDEIGEEILKRNPDIVSISALTPTIGVALDSADKIKNVKPDTVVVLGGYHPTFEYKSVLEEPSVDIVVRGEGEYTMLELVQSIENGRDLVNVQGLAFLDESDDSLIVTPDRPIIKDLDELPFPAFHLFPMEKYRILNITTNVATIITTRGCPMQCSFCSSAALHGNHLRRRSYTNVCDEIEMRLKEENIDTIAFMDDTFTLNKKFVRDFCNEIKRRNLKFWWGCTSRVDTLDEEILQLMKDSGCITIFIGVESADQQMLEKMNKNITISKTKKAFKLARKVGIRTIASCVIGMPEDTKKSIQKTIDFVKELNPNYALYSLATPYPGTRFYNETFKKNLIQIKDWSKFTLIDPVLETIDCSSNELRSIQKKAFLKFYLRPGYLIKQASQDGMILLKTIFGIAKQLISRQTNGNTDYNKTNVNK
ncbi:MAG: cobalamin-dependent protein [Methanobrevibacter sp.]|uniref:B12-binding domain-containing radical SAM protein n=1 Tax=Methanobrevibacter sp. TaxID=66852 RepID=UPI0025E6A7AD|nr:radical SAM protein [Methanobrevibacter sp.]MBR0270488.1 cobalamin-dependent protein [Methanobrevibacter sp.]